MFKSPCKDCGKRMVGCHSSCEDYKAAQEAYQAERTTSLKERRNEVMFADYYCVARAKRERGNKRVQKPLGKR